MHEVSTGIRIRKNFCDVPTIHSGLKQDDALSPLLCNFLCRISSEKVEENREGKEFKDLNKVGLLTVHTDHVNFSGEI
jgi:hypothetical protein